MCTYCGTRNYHKIYENHHGPILREPSGRAYEVHHIDGNHENNNPLNLTLVTLQEHYDIHYSQGDYGACYFMAIQRMNKTPEELSNIARLNMLNQVSIGAHPFLGGKMQSGVQTKLVKENKHIFQHELSNSQRLKNGSHPSQVKVGCIHCRLIASISNFIKYHGDNCIKVKSRVPLLKKECPYCHKMLDKGNYAQHHGDKCKNNPNRTI